MQLWSTRNDVNRCQYSYWCSVKFLTVKHSCLFHIYDEIPSSLSRCTVSKTFLSSLHSPILFKMCFNINDCVYLHSVTKWPFSKQDKGFMVLVIISAMLFLSCACFTVGVDGADPAEGEEVERSGED